jgi:chemotaxis protein CheX
MKVQLLNCYANAAVEILSAETGVAVEREGIVMEANGYTTEDVTAVVGITGDLSGSLLLSMSKETALGLVSTMLGQPTEEFDELARSGIAELANVIAGHAGMALSEQGHTTTISPPLLLVGAGAQLSMFDMKRLVVPLVTARGSVRIHVALREVAS